MAWAILVWFDDRTTMHSTMPSSQMELRALLIIALWILMMIAMMLPTAMPMILAFHKIEARHRPDEAFVAAWLFVAGYLLLWSGVGVFAGVLAGQPEALRSAGVGGVILMMAGIYQLTPLKEFCLIKCRSPVNLVIASSGDEKLDEFYTGLLHGVYCVGCCWMLFLALFPLGMTIAAMAAVTLIIFAEKTLPWPRVVPYATGAVLVLYGALMVATPQLSPSFNKDGTIAPAETPMKMTQRLP